MLIPDVFPHYKIDVKLTLAAVRFNCKEPEVRFDWKFIDSSM